MKRVMGAILFVVYSIIAITVTVLLLSFNEYKCSEVGGYTVFIVQDDALEPKYNEGSILLIKSTNTKHVNAGDKAFFYKVRNSQEFDFVTKTIDLKTQQGNHTIYTTSDGEVYDSEYFIGKVDDTTVINSPWGIILSILESKWGYLFCIVIVSLLLFLQEVFDLVIEIKYGGTKGTKAANVANARKNAQKGTRTTTTKTPVRTATKSATVAKTVAKTVTKTTEANNTQSGVEKEG